MNCPYGKSRLSLPFCVSPEAFPLLKNLPPQAQFWVGRVLGYYLKRQHHLIVLMSKHMAVPDIGSNKRVAEG